MTKTMKIQVILEPGTPAADVLELGLLAEQNGIDTVWTSNFPATRDPFLSLVPLAGRSQRIRLGVLPISPHEKHPVKIADTVYTLNELAPGRVTVLIGGLGRSGMNAMGLAPGRRVTAVRECVEILKGVSHERPLNYQGALYQAGQYFPAWADEPPPRVYTGANQPQMLRMSAQVADGIMLSDATLEMLPGILDDIGTGLAKAGRDRGGLYLNNFFAWHVKRDRDAAVAEARQELVWRGVLQHAYIAPVLSAAECELVEQNWDSFLAAFINKTPDIEGIPDDVVDRLLDHLTFTGGLDEVDRVVDELRQFRDAGLDEIALRLHREPDEAIRIIGEHIVPALAG